ncbi:MAG TPA: hypothetical protein DHW64_13080 [Chitinophagaceae bacterium]|nr:hypothetical protein [Chitinophagaceae bacterium]
MCQKINNKTSFFVKFVHISRINPVWIFEFPGVIHSRQSERPESESPKVAYQQHIKNKFL